MFFIDFDPFLFFLMGFDCFEHDGGRCGWGTVWMGTALNKFDLIGCVFYWAGTAPGGTAWGTAFPNIRTVWSEVSRRLCDPTCMYTPLVGANLLLLCIEMGASDVHTTRRQCTQKDALLLGFSSGLIS